MEKSFLFKECAEGLFYTNLNDPAIITSTTNVYPNSYSYLSTVKNRHFLLILELKERREFESYSNIFTGWEHQILRLTYKKK